MKVFTALTLLLLLSGCAVRPIYFDGETITYNHGTARFNSAMSDAIRQCSSVGKLVKHESTTCPYTCISTFVCTEKK